MVLAAGLGHRHMRSRLGWGAHKATGDDAEQKKMTKIKKIRWWSGARSVIFVMMLLHGEKRTSFYSRQSARSSERSCTSARSWPGSSTTTGSPFLWSTHRFENQFQDSWSWHCQCLTRLWSRQVVTLAVYSYFGAAVIGAQWVIPDNEQAYKVSLFLTWSHLTWSLGGTKNTNFQNSMGALSNPISFATRISKQFLFSF